MIPVPQESSCPCLSEAHFTKAGLRLTSDLLPLGHPQAEAIRFYWPRGGWPGEGGGEPPVQPTPGSREELMPHRSSHCPHTQPHAPCRPQPHGSTAQADVPGCLFAADLGIGQGNNAGSPKSRPVPMPEGQRSMVTGGENSLGGEDCTMTWMALRRGRLTLARAYLGG